MDEWKAGGAVKDELGGTAKLSKTTKGTLNTIIDTLQVGSLEQSEVRRKAFSWLAERVNTFVNVLRPRMRSAAADYQSRGEYGHQPKVRCRSWPLQQQRLSTARASCAPAHPYQTPVDIASLMPNAEVTVYPWREPRS